MGFLENKSKNLRDDAELFGAQIRERCCYERELFYGGSCESKGQLVRTFNKSM